MSHGISEVEISIVSPVYRASDTLVELHRRLTVALNDMGVTYEIILVDDGCPEKSWNVIERLVNSDPQVRGIQLSRNFGQHTAIAAGLKNAIGNWVVVMDCDLQEPPEEIPRLYQEAKKGFDVVLTKRTERKGSLSKRASSFVFHAFLSVFSDSGFDSNVANFRILSAKVVVYLNQMPEKIRYLAGMVSWLGFKTSVIRVEHQERFSGRSSYGFWKLLSLAFNWTLAYSQKPLKLVLFAGAFISICSCLIGTYFLFISLFRDVPVQGWTSLIVSIYFLGGVILMVLGVVGLYVGKIFDEVRGRPLYAIDQVLNLDKYE